MCGRFSQQYSWHDIWTFSQPLTAEPRNLQPRYNIAPTTPIDILRNGRAGRELVTARWGLVPTWWKKPLKELPATFNARSETVADKPMWRGAFKSRRCVVPASGFFEWTGPKAKRVPHYFSAADGSPILGFAGLWDTWRDPESDELVVSATIIVTAANDWMSRYHDRMPVMLGANDIGPWLSGEAGTEVLKPPPEETLREWVVDQQVNKAGAGDDDPETIAPVSARPSE